MKDVKVLGTGCRNCHNTQALIEEVAKARGVEIRLEKVDQIADILRWGILATPGVVIDGQVLHSGGVLSRKQVESWRA
ncbi:MAG: thioredoxin family protein [Chromatiaceae bacterium]